MNSGAILSWPFPKGQFPETGDDVFLPEDPLPPRENDIAGSLVKNGVGSWAT